MELLTYLLKVSACSMLFFAFYLIMLRKLTFFKFNRFYLLVTLMLSFIIPALQFTIEREVSRVATIDSSAVYQDVDLNGPSIQQPIIVGNGPVDQEQETISWYSLLPYIYSAIVAALLLLATWRLVQLLKHTGRSAKRINGLKIVNKNKGFTNCSFFNYVFIDQETLTESELNVLLRHEEVHARQFHSIDKIIMMVAKSILWFNPVIYFYDKAMEQTHEYEADEVTSADFGTSNYANLLLRLAVEKGNIQLVHNFVKSPIKARIKMLFNDKSKTMKKLIYLLVIPIGLVLTWGFTVNVVYAIAAPVQEPAQQDTSKIVKTKAQTTLEAKTYLKSPAYADRLREGSRLKDQTLNGKIGADYLHKEALFNQGKLFSVGNKTYILQAGYGMKELKGLKTGDEVEVKVAGTSFSKNVPYLVVNAATIKKNNVVVYVKPPVEKHPFLYEANRARFATTKIKSIEKDANGTINKIVLYDGIYTINLNLTAQKLKNSTFKAGDLVLVKFFGEKLTANKVYTTDKMIVLYSQPKKYELKNEALYGRFYNQDGTQIVKALNAVDGDTYQSKNEVFKSNPEQITTTKENSRVNSIPGTIYNSNNKANQINTATSVYNLVSKLPYYAQDSVRISKTANTVTLYGDAKLNINSNVLSGNKIVVDKSANTVTAYSATLTGPGAKTISAETIYFDGSNNTIRTEGNKVSGFINKEGQK